MEVLSRGKDRIGPAFARLGPPNHGLDISFLSIEYDITLVLLLSIAFKCILNVNRLIALISSF